MGGFQFRLQSVFDLRKQQEKEQRERFSNETALLNRLVDFDEKLKQEYADWAARYMKSAQVGISPLDAVQMQGYLKEIAKMLDQNKRRITVQESSVENERQRLVVRMQERKIIEILREKQHNAFISEQNKIQEKEIEENILSKIKQR